jgi:NhaA family Na+:H+ antiporter
MQNPSETKAVLAGVLPRRIREFMAKESAGGMVMIAAALIALTLANSPLSLWYKEFVSARLSVGFGETAVAAPLKEIVKDVLMVFFFFVVGMELKREACEGFLSRRDQILLPMAAALGGMAAPALVFFGLNHHSPETVSGWAIPSATDIAFALAALALLGKGMPPSVKIFLLAVAIFDDLGAIVIIAAFYNHGLAVVPLLAAAGGVAALALFGRAKVAAFVPYLAIGVFLWFCFHYSGVHTTLAGVLVGLAIPMREKRDARRSPLNAYMHFLHPWVGFLVLPLFAFVSAGVDVRDVRPADFAEPLPLGIALGLFFGKQIGVFGAAWLLIKTGLARLPEASGWRHMYAASIMAGIGFTMSLFIGMLAFSAPHLQDMVKLGVISGSLLCVAWGGIVLRIALRPR